MHYFAPEILINPQDSYLLGVDVYSFGVILY